LKASGPLYMDRTAGERPPTGTIVLQLTIGLAAIVGGAHLFVEEEGEQLLLGQGGKGQPWP